MIIRLVGNLFNNSEAFAHSLDAKTSQRPFEQWISLGDFGWNLSELFQYPPNVLKIIGWDNEIYTEDSKKAINALYNVGAECIKNFPGYLGDSGILPDEPQVFFHRGAFSENAARKQAQGFHDRHSEYLDVTEATFALQRYRKVKPKIILSHTAPSFLLKDHLIDATSEFFEYSVYSHPREASDITQDGVRFICVPENGFIDVNTKTLHVTT